MGLAAPVGIGRERDRVRLGRQRDASARRRRHRPDVRARRPTGRAPRPAAPRRPRVVGRRTRSRRRLSATSAKTRSRPASTSCDHDQQLAEPRLAEVLGQQLRVPAPELAGVRLLQLSGAAHQIPQHAPAVVDRGASRERRAESTRHQNGPRCRRRPIGPAMPQRPPRSAAAPSTSSTSRGSHVGSASGANAPSTKLADSRAASPLAAADADHASARSRSETRSARPPSRRAAPRRAPATAPAPTDDHPQQRRATVEAADRGARQKPFSSQSRCAPSTAANSAPTTPMPRPATTSILTPASWSARSTPA